MKELLQNFSSHNSTSEPEISLNNRTRIKKNVMIRKNKVAQKLANDQNPTIKLSKEERNQLQKIKNRESAQRSRDMKKLYIEQLEQQNSALKFQIKDLKQKIQRRPTQLCPKCGYLQQQQKQNLLLYKNMDEQNQQINLLQPQININDQVQYERILEQNRINKFQLLSLFVIVILGILIFDHHTETKTPQILFNLNGLDQFKTNQNLQQIKFNQNSIFQQSQKKISSQLALNNKIQPSQDTCLIQYLNQKKRTFPQLIPFKNLRSRNIDHYYQNNDILFCHMPQIIKHNKSQSLVSNNLQILIKGSQLENALQHKGSKHNIYPNDLYMLFVEVKDIVNYPNLQCLT